MGIKDAKITKRRMNWATEWLPVIWRQNWPKCDCGVTGWPDISNLQWFAYGIVLGIGIGTLVQCMACSAVKSCFMVPFIQLIFILCTIYFI